jgi:hypothetical protein
MMFQKNTLTSIELLRWKDEHRPRLQSLALRMITSTYKLFRFGALSNQVIQAGRSTYAPEGCFSYADS